mgnify:CR=1 FL=1
MAETLPLPMERKLFFTEQFTQKSVAALTEKIVEINRDDRLLEKLYPVYDMEYKAKPIEIMIDSYGGMVYQCMGLVSVVENSDTPVWTYVTGAAMSCGFILLISGHKRFAYKRATPLYHQVSSGAFGKVKDMEERVEETKRLQDILEDITIEKTKISKKKLTEIYEKKIDWYMSSSEALALGVVDEII